MRGTIASPLLISTVSLDTDARRWLHQQKRALLVFALINAAFFAVMGVPFLDRFFGVTTSAEVFACTPIVNKSYSPDPPGFLVVAKDGRGDIEGTMLHSAALQSQIRARRGHISAQLGPVATVASNGTLFWSFLALITSALIAMLHTREAPWYMRRTIYSSELGTLEQTMNARIGAAEPPPTL